MGAVPGYNALSGVSSILHSAIVKESSNICDYIQGAVRIGMDFVQALALTYIAVRCR